MIETRALDFAAAVVSAEQASGCLVPFLYNSFFLCFADPSCVEERYELRQKPAQKAHDEQIRRKTRGYKIESCSAS